MSNYPRKVILDVDAGIDDAWAILVMLRAEQKNLVEIIAITCCHGNAELPDVVDNVCRILQAFGRKNIPIYRGVSRPLIPKNLSNKYSSDWLAFFGKNGFGDVDLEDSDKIDRSCVVDNISAVVALHELTREFKGLISVLCLAPLTNIALTLRLFPEFSFNAKELYIMGGNHKGVGNVTPAAEFNSLADPESAHIVLGTFKGPIHVLPWETCLALKLPYEWRYGTLGACDHPCISLLNRVEKVCTERALTMGYNTWLSADSVLCACFLDEKVITVSYEAFCSVELSGDLTRGQTVVDVVHSKTPNVRMIATIDEKMVKDILLWAKE
uniref:Inosine-uridine preferring nucleoside hydrolase n=2 Tax=Cacopsylla melanoneura TaxID=428564 RepID=A0A8D9B3E1_9HEMI